MPEGSQDPLSFIPAAWRMPVVVVVALVVLVFIMTGLSNQPGSNLPPSNPVYVPPSNNITPPTALPVEPTINITHDAGSSPTAGTPITFTAEVQYADDLDRVEVWWKQFGNWKITRCDSSPCSYTVQSAAAGTHYYLSKLYLNDGRVIARPVTESYTLQVLPAVKTGDTIPPKIVVFHEPVNPHAGNSVSITASVSDVSGIEGVDIYVNNELKKTCPQKVKIAQCGYIMTNPGIGTYEYYATATDTYGNAGQSEPLSFTVTS